MEKKLFSMRKFAFLISNSRRVVNVPFFLVGDSPKSEFYVPTFLKTLSVPSHRCSETSARKIQKPGNHPKQNKTKKNTSNVTLLKV